jgi:hypothetical protein
MTSLSVSTTHFRELVPLKGFVSAGEQALADSAEAMVRGVPTIDNLIPTSDSMLNSTVNAFKSFSCFAKLSDAPLGSILTQTSMSKFQEVTIMLGDIFTTYGIQVSELELLIFQACLPNFGTATYNPGTIGSFLVMSSENDTVKIDSVSTNILSKVKSELSKFLTTSEFTDLSKLFKKQYEKNEVIQPTYPDVVDTTYTPKYNVVPFSKQFTNATSSNMDSFMREKINTIVSVCWHMQKVINTNASTDTSKTQTGLLTNLFGLHYSLATVACASAEISMWQFIARYMVEHFYMHRAINDGFLVIEDRQMFPMKDDDSASEMAESMQSLIGVINTEMPKTFPNVKFEQNFEIDEENRVYYLVTTLKNQLLKYEKTQLDFPQKFNNDMTAQGLEPLEVYVTKSYTMNIDGSKDNEICTDVRVILNYNNDDSVLNGIDMSGEGWQGVASVARGVVNTGQGITGFIDFVAGSSKCKMSARSKKLNKKIELGLSVISLFMAGEKALGTKEDLIQFKRFGKPCTDVETYIKLLRHSSYNSYFVGYDENGSGEIVNKGTTFNIDFSSSIDKIDSTYSNGTALKDGILHFYNLGVSKMTTNVRLANTQAYTAAIGLVTLLTTQVCDAYFKMPIGTVAESMAKQPIAVTRAASFTQAANATSKVKSLIGVTKTYTNAEVTAVAAVTALGAISFLASAGASIDAKIKGTNNSILLNSDGALSRTTIAVYDKNSRNNLFFNTTLLVLNGIPWFDTETVNAVQDAMIVQYFILAKASNTIPWQNVPLFVLSRLKSTYMPSIIDIQCMDDSDNNITSAFSNSLLDRWLYTVAMKFFTDFDSYVSTYLDSTEFEASSGIRTLKNKDNILKIHEFVTYKNNKFELGDFASKLYSVEMEFVSTFRLIRFSKDESPVTEEERATLTNLINQINAKLAPWKNSLSTSSNFTSGFSWMNPASSSTLGEKYGVYYDQYDNLSSLTIGEREYNEDRISDLTKYMNATNLLKGAMSSVIATYNAVSVSNSNLSSSLTRYNSAKTTVNKNTVISAYKTLDGDIANLKEQLNLIVTLDSSNQIVGGYSDNWSDSLKVIKPIALMTTSDRARSGYLAPLRDNIIIPAYITVINNINSFIQSTVSSPLTSAVFSPTNVQNKNALANAIITSLKPFVLPPAQSYTVSHANIKKTYTTSYFTQLTLMVNDETDKLTDGLKVDILKNVVGTAVLDGKVNTYNEIIATNKLKLQYYETASCFFQGGYGFGSLF